MLKDYNIGVTLFEANSDFTNFTKVSHNKKTGSIDQKPCTN